MEHTLQWRQCRGWKAGEYDITIIQTQTPVGQWYHGQVAHGKNAVCAGGKSMTALSGTCARASTAQHLASRQDCRRRSLALHCRADTNAANIWRNLAQVCCSAKPLGIKLQALGSTPGADVGGAVFQGWHNFWHIVWSAVLEALHIISKRGTAAC